MSFKTILSIIGPRDSAIRVGGLCNEIYRMYSTATSEFVEIPDYYERDPHILELEKAGMHFAAAVKKISLIYDNYSKIESVGSDIVIVNNYVDEIIMQFIYNELQKLENVGDDLSAIENKASTLIALALQEFNIHFPGFSIPINASDDPSKVIYPPIVFDIFKKTVSQFLVYESSDYIFPSSDIQVVAYYAFGLYNRYCNAIANPERSYFTLKNEPIPVNYFALIQESIMPQFEEHLPDASMKINYNGKSVFEPLYVKDLQKENYQVDENEPGTLVNDIPDMEGNEEELLYDDEYEEDPDSEETPVEDLPNDKGV